MNGGQNGENTPSVIHYHGSNLAPHHPSSAPGGHSSSGGSNLDSDPDEVVPLSAIEPTLELNESNDELGGGTLLDISHGGGPYAENNGDPQRLNGHECDVSRQGSQDMDSHLSHARPPPPPYHPAGSPTEKYHHGGGESSSQDHDQYSGGNPTTYNDFILRLIYADIQNTCIRLQLPEDPVNWNQDHVWSWVKETLYVQGLSIDPMSCHGITGLSLSCMNLTNFRCAFPPYGDVLKSCFDLWVQAVTHCTWTREASPPVAPSGLGRASEHHPYTSHHQGSANRVPSSIPPPSGNSHHNQLYSHTHSHLQHQSSSSSSSVSSPEYMDHVTSFPEPPVMSHHGHGHGSGVMGHHHHHHPSLSHPGVHPSHGYYYRNHSGSSLSPGSPDSDDEESFRYIDDQTGLASTNTIHLWQFLRHLLESPTDSGNCIRWVSKPQGIFKIENSASLAKLWGKRKNRPAMNYDKLSRSLRQYYKKGILQKTPRSQRLIYQFCPSYRG